MTEQRKIELIKQTPIWKEFFAKEEFIISKILRNNFIAAHHIGSTAIPGILTKPTLDVLIEVHTLDGIEVFKDEFEKQGLHWQGENGIKGRLYFIRFAPDMVTHIGHIHIFEKQNTLIDDHLDFRDYLIAEPEVAQKYEQLKQALRDQFPNDPTKYTEGKNEFIKTVLRNIT